MTATRASLYARFNAYIPFAEGYNCALDCAGGLASEKIFPLAHGRELQFIGLNSALVCQKKDEEGKLLLGARQRVLPVQPGREIVVLSHHPLHWLQIGGCPQIRAKPGACLHLWA